MKEIALDSVNSSQIFGIGHDPETNTLAVQFKNFKTKDGGDVYHYQNVSVEKFNEFKNSDSIGVFFKAHLKNPEEHPFTKIQKGE